MGEAWILAPGDTLLLCGDGAVRLLTRAEPVAIEPGSLETVAAQVEPAGDAGPAPQPAVVPNPLPRRPPDRWLRARDHLHAVVRTVDVRSLVG